MTDIIPVHHIYLLQVNWAKLQICAEKEIAQNDY